MKHIIPLSLFSLMTIGCSEDPPRQLLVADRKIADSLYLERVTILKPQADSICAANFEKRVQRAADSILIERRAEIKVQMDRLKELKAGK